MQKTIEDVKNSMEKYDFVLAYEFSDIKFGKTSETAVNWNECMEAYLISETGQIHVYSKNGELVADEFEESSVKYEHSDRTYIVREGVALHGKTIKVREYLDTDEDGQAFVKYSRIIGVN